MSELTTYCSDCSKNHTIECTDARKNSWRCPDYVKKMSEHEKHIMRIAEESFNCMVTPKWLREHCNDYIGGLKACVRCRYDWMMSLKEDSK